MSLQPMLLREISFTDDVFEKYKDWLWQEKQNGERALIHIQDEKVSAMRNRSDNPVHQRWPEISKLKFTGIKSAVLDCEVIVEMDGKSKFYDGVNQRRAVPTPERLKSFPVRAIVFDLLYIDGQSFIGKPYSERLALLSSKFLGFECDALKIVRNIDNPKEYWDSNIVGENREGFVIKDPKAQYYPGLRMACQLKLKNYKQENVIVEALETNNKGVKITGTTPSGIKGEIQYSSCGFESIKKGDIIPVEYLDVVNGKMVQPHKIKGYIIDGEN